MFYLMSIEKSDDVRLLHLFEAEPQGTHFANNWCNVS